MSAFRDKAGMAFCAANVCFLPQAILSLGSLVGWRRSRWWQIMRALRHSESDGANREHQKEHVARSGDCCRDGGEHGIGIYARGTDRTDSLPSSSGRRDMGPATR